MKRTRKSLGLVLLVLVAMGLAVPRLGGVVHGQGGEPSCTDSDGGLNYEVAGYVEGIGPSGWPYAKYDFCETGDREGEVREFFCNGTTPWPQFYLCPYGCADGACIPATCTDADDDGYAVEGGGCGPVDCDDTDPAVNPDAAEVCDNGIDDDCDGLIDADDPDCVVCTDADGDSYAIEGGGCGSIDCDDTDPAINPGAAEVCDNGVDDDCDGLIDADDPDCATCTDADGDGYAIEGEVCGPIDCDDANPAVNPGAAEVCDNGIDDDCDGFVDADDSDCGACTDSDGGLNYEVAGRVDGVGANGWPVTRYDVCESGEYEGSVREYYCNGTTPWPTFYECPYGCADGACVPWSSACTDADGDGYAVEGGVCGLVDCDDANPNVNPDAGEICDNGIDDNCDGWTDAEDLACLVCTDADGDGYAIEGGACGLVDCDDANPQVNPSAIEICDNGIDDNCNGSTDAEDAICSGPPNMIVVGWDGVQRDHFWECYNKELPECPDGLPNVEALSGGVIFDNVITNGGTATKPGWAQILSGYDAEVTGV
ncbi:MAG: hypothetical protein GTO49_07515, partial [Anaerolineae bacterium]|nr:hypothetical protein [Anaerolineae bacterium]